MWLYMTNSKVNKHWELLYIALNASTIYGTVLLTLSLNTVIH